MEVVVLGAGVAGLAAGMEVSGKHKVIVLEKEDYIGGLAASYNIKWEGKNYWIPANYHHILEDDIYTKDVIKKLGLWDNFYTTKIKFAFHIDGKFIRISSPKGFFAFPAPLSEKIKFALLLVKVNLRKDFSNIEKYNSKEWVEKKVGPHMYSKLIKPLQTFKSGSNPDTMGAVWLATRLAAEAKNFLKKFGYLKGGLHTMVQGMEKKIEGNGGKVLTNCKITKINKKGKRAVEIEFIQGKKKRKIKCDYIISSIPLPQIVKLCGLKDKRYLKMKYRGSICLCCGVKGRLTPNYWSMYLDEKYHFAASFEHTNLYPKAGPAGKSIFYPVKYTGFDDPLWEKNNKEVIKEFTRQLNDVFPDFSERLEWCRVFRELYSEPVFDIKYKQYAPPMQTELENVVLCGMPFAPLFFPGIRNMSTSIGTGLKAGEIALSYLGNHPK